MPMRIIDRPEIAERLTYERCFPLLRRAMIAFSQGQTQQLLRSIIPLAHGNKFGIMPGTLGLEAAFGAKLISVYEQNRYVERQSHQGVIVLFEPASGEPVCIVHAGEVTAIRTAAASAIATDALARPNSHKLAILGCGEQAATHLRAITKIRPIESIAVWGRNQERAAQFCRRMSEELDRDIRCLPQAQDTVRDADIVCTVTSSEIPVLYGHWIKPGTHVNLVGSSTDHTIEADINLVALSRFIVDSREGVLNQGAEFRRAKAAGIVDDAHIVAEIGQVLSGEVPGRTRPDEITVYKSLGHIVQDLACAWELYTYTE